MVKDLASLYRLGFLCWNSRHYAAPSHILFLGQEWQATDRRRQRDCKKTNLIGQPASHPATEQTASQPASQPGIFWELLPACLVIAKALERAGHICLGANGAQGRSTTPFPAPGLALARARKHARSPAHAPALALAPAPAPALPFSWFYLAAASVACHGNILYGIVHMYVLCLSSQLRRIR